MSRTVSVDFDGVLHPYTKGWVGFEPDDEPPVEGAREFLVTLNNAGYDVVVSSCRADTIDGERGIIHWLRRHQLDHLVSDVTDAKPVAVAYVDDRAVPYRAGNWDQVISEVSRLANGRVHGVAPVAGEEA